MAGAEGPDATDAAEPSEPVDAAEAAGRETPAAGPARPARITREGLIRNLWPDKFLFGTVLLLVASVMGALFAVVRLAFPVGYGENVPFFLTLVPPEATLGLCVLSAGLAYAAYDRLDARLAAGAVLAGVASFGLVGVTSALALVTAALLLRARREGEDTSPHTAALGPHLWPDKCLAASLLSLVNGAITLWWSAGVLVAGTMVVDLGQATPLLGAFGVVAGASALLAARALYRQRGPRLAAASAVACIAAVGMYVVGPLLGAATLAAVALAVKEQEFDTELGVTPT